MHPLFETLTENHGLKFDCIGKVVSNHIDFFAALKHLIGVNSQGMDVLLFPSLDDPSLLDSYKELVNSKDSAGFYPLHYVIRSIANPDQRMLWAKALLERGADPTAHDLNGEDAFDYTSQNWEAESLGRYMRFHESKRAQWQWKILLESYKEQDINYVQTPKVALAQSFSEEIMTWMFADRNDLICTTEVNETLQDILKLCRDVESNELKFISHIDISEELMITLARREEGEHVMTKTELTTGDTEAVFLSEQTISSLSDQLPHKVIQEYLTNNDAFSAV